MNRLRAWNNAAIAADADDARHQVLGLTDGDRPGTFVSRIRSLAAMPADSFRRLLLALGLGLGLSQAVVAVLSGQSRNVRAVASGFSGLVGLLLAIGLSIALLGRYVRVSIRTFRAIAFVSAALLGFIMLTGSAVRLTGSGLGCPDWPTCKAGNIVPASGRHAAIEFGNRVVTGLCLLAAAVGVLTALVRRPFRRDLVFFGLIVSAGLFANAVLGGLTVIFDLQPQFVMSHFLLAIACLAVGAVLFHRCGETGPSGSLLGRNRRSTIDTTMRLLSNALTGMVLLIVIVGCVLTGSGPHGGDPKVRRFGFSMLDVVRLHSGLVWVTLLLIVVMAGRVRSAKTPAVVEVRRRIGVLALVAVAQGGIGYWQWFTQLPALLVQVHILGAISVWCAVLWVRAAVTVPAAELGRAAVPLATERAAVA